MSISTGDELLSTCDGSKMREVEGVIRWKEKLEEGRRAGVKVKGGRGRAPWSERKVGKWRWGKAEEWATRGGREGEGRETGGR